MASGEDVRQPLINPFTPHGSLNVKYTESVPITTLTITSDPISSKIENVSNNKKRLGSKLKEKKSSVKDTFMLNMSHRLALRLQLYNRLSLLTDIMCVFGLLGIILMIIENEITFQQVNQRDTVVTWSIKLIITITTAILVGLVFFYHHLNLMLYSINNSTNDWRIGLTNKKIFLIIIEVMICAIHPVVRSFPHHTNTDIEETDVDFSSLSYISIDVALGLPMFARLYLLCRCIVYHSHFVHDVASQSLGYLNEISINFFFLIKTYLEQRPIRFLVICCTLMFFIGSWSLRACDYDAPNEHVSIFDAMWLLLVTYTTVGYGDVTPSSYCGRSIAALIALVGLLSNALLIAVLVQKLMLNRGEKYLHNFVVNTELAKERKIQAANIVKYSIKLWYLRRMNRSVVSIEYLQIQRKLFQTVNIIHQIKKTRRELIDACIGLPEIVTIQRHTSTNIDQTIKKIETLEIKIDNIENQLINVNQTINSLQSTLNFLVDKIVK